MAQAGYTPIQLYYSTSAAAVPDAANLIAGELAINTQDEVLYFKNAAGTVKRLAATINALANGGTGSSLTDPGADRILFWDDSAGAVTWLEAGSGLSISGSTISATGSGGTVTSVDVSGGTTGLTASGGPITSSGTITLSGTLNVANGGTGITSFGTGVATALGQNVTGSGGIVLATGGTVSGVTLNDGYTEEVFALGTSGSLALEPDNGSIQTCALTGNPTFTDGLSAGQSIVLMLTNGASYTVTWPTMTWVTSAGNVAPTLTAADTLVFWKVSTTLYGAYVGSYV